jgi:hypothetical protein
MLSAFWVYSRQEDDDGEAPNVTEPVVGHDAQIDEDEQRAVLARHTTIASIKPKLL